MSYPAFTFPHNSRFFSAGHLMTIATTGKYILLWVGLGLCLGINVAYRLENTPFEPYISILRSPLSSQIHLETASKFWNSGFEIEARNEAALAQDLTSHGSVLGTQEQLPENLLKQWETESIRYKDQLRYWKGIVKNAPDYRDGFIMAARNAYLQGEKLEAQLYIDQAFALDPLSLPVRELKKTIEERLK